MRWVLDVVAIALSVAACVALQAGATRATERLLFDQGSEANIAARGVGDACDDERQAGRARSDFSGRAPVARVSRAARAATACGPA